MVVDKEGVLVAMHGAVTVTVETEGTPESAARALRTEATGAEEEMAELVDAAGGEAAEKALCRMCAGTSVK